MGLKVAKNVTSDNILGNRICVAPSVHLWSIRINGGGMSTAAGRPQTSAVPPHEIPGTCFTHAHAVQPCGRQSRTE